MRAHGVCQRKRRAGLAQKQRTPLVQPRDCFAGEIVKRHEPAAVRRAFQRFFVERLIQRALVVYRAKRLCRFVEEANPGVNVARAVVAVHHCDRVARGRGHHVHLGIRARERPFQNQHRKHAGSGADVARALTDAVGRDHAGARVAFRRAERNASLQHTARVEQCRALWREPPGFGACGQEPGKDIRNLPSIALLGDQLLERFQHAFVERERVAVHREHAGAVANAKHAFTRQPNMQVAGERREKRDGANVRFLVQHCLIQVRNAPALRNVKVKAFRERFRRRSGRCVAPGAKRREQAVVLVEREVAMHHGGNAHCADARERLAIGC